MAPTESIVPENKLTSKQAILVGFLIGGIAIAAMHYLFRENMKQKIASLSSQIASVQTQLNANQKLVDMAPKLKTQYNELGQRLATLQATQLVPEDANRWGNSLIEKLSADFDMTVKSFNTAGVDRLGITRRTESGMQIIPCIFEEFRSDIQLKGQYHQFGRFLAQLEADLPAMRMSSLRLSPVSKKPEDGLNISLQASFLRFSDEGFVPSLRPQANEFSLENDDETNDS